MKIPLNLPVADLHIRTNHRGEEVFDVIRKKFVALTPEEWVRQHVIGYLHSVKQMPLALMAVEKAVRVNRLERRPDIVVYNQDAVPALIVECKAPQVAVGQRVFDQVARYNIGLSVPYLLVTNGLHHYCCRVDIEKKRYVFLEEIPAYDEL